MTPVTSGLLLPAVMGYQELFQRVVPIELRPGLGEALSADEVRGGESSSSTSGIEAYLQQLRQ
jgi:hypothetical protein